MSTEFRWTDAPVVVRAPASSANLGPGFDSLGLALSLHDVAVARVTSGGLDIEVSGAGRETADAGEDHLVVRAMRAAFGLLGGQPPGLGLRSLNTIPHRRGLGSSAAAIVAGILAARALTRNGPELLPDPAVLQLATELEGHPDNVAACLHGSLTIAWTADPPGPAGTRMVRLPVLEEIRPVLCIPAERLSTTTARGALPAAVPHRDAAANAARSALLVAALTRVPAVLFDATQDYLHQPYRAEVMPQTAELLGRLRAAGVAATVSGAGPSVLALTVAGTKTGPDLVDSIAAETGIGWRISPLDIDRQGATLQTAVPAERS
ncbi:MAG: homoserine kinase [Streptosporangiaceae bacterium]